MSDDDDLVARMRAGEQRAFNQFFDAYAVRIGKFAARRSALDQSAVEDVVQLTMINAMQKLASFRGESSMFTWLSTICRNHLADARRKAARLRCRFSFWIFATRWMSVRTIQVVARSGALLMRCPRVTQKFWNCGMATSSA